jgi:hypothetical protein
LTYAEDPHPCPLPEYQERGKEVEARRALWRFC